MKRRILISILFPIFLNACGFRLKSDKGNFIGIRHITLDMSEDDESLRYIFKRIFQRRGISFSNHARYLIRISNIRRQRLHTAIGVNVEGSDTKEIELQDSFQAEIFDRKKRLGGREISSRSIIRYHSSAYLGSSQEEERTHRRLADDNVNQLIRYFSALIQ